MAGEWFCAKCGEEAPLKEGYIVVDPRFAIVRHHKQDQQGTSDPKLARAIRAEVEARRHPVPHWPPPRAGRGD